MIQANKKLTEKNTLYNCGDHLRLHNMSIPEVDELQQWKTTLGSTAMDSPIQDRSRSDKSI